MSNTPLAVLIVGGGIGGLSAAVAMRQAGHRVKVLERFAVDHEVGAAITLHYNATRVLQRWGVDFKKAQMVVNRGVEVLQADITPNISLFNSDEHANAERYPSPYLLSHRVDLHQALYDVATDPGRPGEPAEVIPFTSVVSFDPAGGSVTLQNGVTQAADLVIAADGVRSSANRYILGEERPAKASNTSVIRFLIPTDRILANHKTAQLLKNGDGQTIFYTCDDRMRWVMQNPCRDNTLQNFAVYSMHQKDHDVEEWFTQTDRASLLNRLEGFDPAVLELCRMATDNLPLWKVVDRDPLPLFYRDRLLLLGDACHPMLPFLGQGAAQSMEDAAVLGVIFQGLQDNRNVGHQLEIFQRLRRNRVSAVQLLSRIPVSVLTVSDEMTEQIKPFFPETPMPRHRGEVLTYLYSYDCVEDAERFLREQQ